MDNEKPNTEPPFEEGVQIIVIKHFFAESQARLYAAHLKDAGIPSFISNANIMATLPLGGGGGIPLHIKASDAVAAQRVISRLDFQAEKELEEQNFHDATKEDILYLQAVHEEQNGNNTNCKHKIGTEKFTHISAKIKATSVVCGCIRHAYLV